MGEERKKTTSVRFNLLDIALIVLAVLCVVSVWQRGNLKKIFDRSGVYQSYTVHFSVNDVPQGVAKALTEGVTLYTEEDGTRCTLGTLHEIVSSDPDATGAVDVNGTVMCLILQKDHHFFLKNGPELALNMHLTVESESAVFELVITGIVKNN